MNLKKIQELETKWDDLAKHQCENKYICGKIVNSGVVVFCVGCKQWILLPNLTSIEKV